MDIRKLQRAIVDGLEDVKAHDIAVFNTEALSPLFERVIIATGASNRQTKALASSVRDKVRERGLKVLRTEGEDNGEWIIVDCGAAVAHIMQPSIREYYRLEELWGDKPVRMKLGAKVGQGLVKASEPMVEPAAVAAETSVRPSAKAPAKASAAATAKKQAMPRRAATPRQPPVKGGVRTVVAGKPARKNTKTPTKTTARATAKKAVNKSAPKSTRASGARGSTSAPRRRT